MPLTPERRRRASALTLATALLVPTSLALAPSAQAADQITNGSFDQGTTGWTIYPGPTVTDGAGCMSVPAGSAPYSAAIQQDVPLVKGEQYALSFRARSTPATQGPVRVVVQGGPDVNYQQFLPAVKPAFTADFGASTLYFTADRDYPTAQLAFQQDIVNPVAYTFCVDDVVLQGGAEKPAYQPDTGSRVRVNQEAYLPKGPKGATLVTDATTALPWQLKNAAGAVVASGRSTPRGVDPTAGLSVHSIDFGGFTRAGDGYTLTADGQTSHPFAIGDAAYERLRVDAKTFFYTNRSGTPISDAVAPGYGRAAGHVGVAPNQGDTAVPCQSLTDDSQKLLVKQGDAPFTCDYTSDVTGGWYDAGDHGKYVVNGGIAVAQLLQEFERTRDAATADRGALGDRTLRVPEAGNKVPDVLDEARWELEWFLKMQVQPGRPLAGMVFHKVADADWTGLPQDPATDPQARVLYRPSTAATLNVAATAAQGARLFAPYDKAFSKRLLAAARTAYAAAQANPAVYAPAPDAALDPNPGSGPYDDRDVSDEFYWAATELYLSTGEPAFRKDVLASPVHTADVFTPGGFDWGHVAPLARMDLATVPSHLNARELRRVRQSVLTAADGYLTAQAAQPFGQAYAPEGGQYAWGSNSAILNNQQVLGTAFDISGRAAYRDGVVRSMDYLLGRNALNRSYITGYGDVYSENQHSRMYAHQLDPALPHPPAGTVAGGPNSTTTTSGDPVSAPLFPNGCAAQFCYVDDIGSWSTNEITVNWNSALSWVASFVADQDNGRDGSHRG
ncbi:glycoside hydrolase family 9 protein [Kineococcus rubinsiae]|uniref:glycoside hydrolase family 9 protein n=1 Tax=Kineococcus rubinsiae TaxID=2609562 RepID=UPI0014313787|nr:glycoside hydrolase family 9 protein [Kineococcus rubinsiae]NIZ93303.1 glycosyl hydrolase family 5 [Kineococcus rubinsiae]